MLSRTKKITVLLSMVLTTIFTSTNTLAENRNDYLHMGSGVAIGMISHQYFTSNKEELRFQTSEEKRMTFYKSSGACLSIGLSKEFYDKFKGNSFSSRDVTMSSIGFSAVALNLNQT